MDSPRESPTSPRLRPSGPRSLNRRQTAKLPASFSLNHVSADEAAPSYSGRTTPEPSSSHGGSVSSPAMTHFEQLPPFGGEPSSPGREPPEQRDVGVQVSLNVPPSRPASTASSAPAVKVITKPPTLTPPPALNFDSVPIAWRGMTLESAQWTLTSAELQEIVSRAIRKTAQESFIRLLSLKVLDDELVAEMERLETVCDSPLHLCAVMLTYRSLGQSDCTIQVPLQHAPENDAASVTRRSVYGRK
jgi:hypothetical protein